MITCIAEQSMDDCIFHSTKPRSKTIVPLKHITQLTATKTRYVLCSDYSKLSMLLVSNKSY